MTSRKARIIGTGSYLPPQRVTNDDLVRRGVDTTSDWIVAKTGIKERRYVDDGIGTSDLGTLAAELALKNAGIAKEKVEAILLATSSPDQPLPGSAAIIQKKLGLHDIPAFDINCVCSGFNYALAVGASLIESGMYSTLLIIGAETYSRLMNFEDRTSCVFFGDGAGAVVLSAEPKEDFGVIGSVLGTDGENYDAIQVKVGGVMHRPTPENLATGGQYFQMDGRRVFEFAVTVIPKVLCQIREKYGFDPRDISWVIPHQANINIIKQGMQKAGYDISRVVTNLEEYGNTAGASIPISLDEANKKKSLKPGDMVLLVGFGAGLSWGANLIRWG